MFIGHLDKGCTHMFNHVGNADIFSLSKLKYWNTTSSDWNMLHSHLQFM